MVPVEEIVTQFARAVGRVEEILREPKGAVARDAAIQRFEFTFDLAWKALKAYLEDRLKVRCASPKACFREAYTQGVIAYENRWVDMADDRNKTAHMYKEEIAEIVYARLPGHLTLFQNLLGKLREDHESP